MVLTVCRLVALLIGMLAYYVAFFMYEDEEGKWQNRIEKVWVAINDREKQSGTRASALFSKVATIVTRAFNCIFGGRLFSARFVGTSISCSFAALFLFVFVFLGLGRPLGLLKPLSPTDLVFVSHVERLSLIAGLLFSFLAILPSLWHSRWSIALSLLPVILFGFGLVFSVGTHSLKPKSSAFFVGLVLSLLSDVLLIALVRFTVRWVSEKASVSRTALAILIQVGIVYFVILVPLAIPAALPDDFRQSEGLMALVVMGSLNLFTALASSVFLLSLLGLLLHRVLWPVLDRILYPLARHQVIRNRKLMVPLGTGCFIFAFPLMPAAIKGILRWLAA